MLSPYGVLGLQPGCNQEEVKAAYKKRALETHPDKGGDVDEFRSVKVAYESLLKSVPAQPTSRKQSDSPVSATSVFSPPGVPFPNAFTTAAAQAAVGVKASHDKVQANSRKRRRVSLEETIELAFASIPRRPRTVNEVPPTAPKAKPKPVSKTVAPKSTGSKPGPSQRSHPQGRQNGHGTSGAEDASAAKLWARLLELSLEKRAAEISALSPRVKERLETFLREKKRLRSETKTESRDSDAESDSSSGSSSSSSTSSETKLTTASQKEKPEVKAESKPKPATPLPSPVERDTLDLERMVAKIRNFQDKTLRRTFIQCLTPQNRRALEKYLQDKRGAPRQRPMT